MCEVLSSSHVWEQIRVRKDHPSCTEAGKQSVTSKPFKFVTPRCFQWDPSPSPGTLQI